MLQVNIHEAKTNLSALLEKTKEGESFVIAKAGKPLAVVSPYRGLANQESPSRIGFLKGAFEIPEDFDALGQDEIIAMFASEN